jgi:uncharacterized membrane protein
VQTAFSILWTLVALASMGVATRRSLQAWIASAVLIAVVVMHVFPAPYVVIYSYDIDVGIGRAEP